MITIHSVVALGSCCFALATAAEFDQSHARFDAVLKGHVKDSLVNYAALKSNRQDLDHYLDQLAAVPAAEFKQWSQPQQIAFLINTYNAFTLRLIIDHYPVRSIKNIGTFFSGPWSQPVVHLFGETITLDAIEHQMLRKNYSEPRIHVALVCAARGCPPLRAEAYRGDRLEQQLTDQMRAFLADANKNRIAVDERTAYLSPIFKWYGGDFEKKAGSVLAFLKPYWPDPSLAARTLEGFRVRYTDYDWSLNDGGKRQP